MSMAVKYAMAKRAKKDSAACEEHGAPNCAMCYGGKMAEGGFVGEEMASGFEPPPEPEADAGEEGIVDRIMKRFSKGGEVTNATAVTADFEANEFDDLAKDDDLEFSDTEANSGDDLGDKAEDDDRKDIVSRVMKSRAKKDKNPRPA